MLGIRQTQNQKAIAKKVNTTHGMRRTKIYACWSDMKKRCNNPNQKDYHNYGGKGIKVCARWNSFAGFQKDMGDSYFNGATIDRVENSKGYYKGNCRWVTRKNQSRNTSRMRLNPELVLLIKERYKNGEKQITIARELGCHKQTVSRAIIGKTWS